MVNRFDKIIENVFIPADDTEVEQRQLEHKREQRAKIKQTALNILDNFKNIKNGYLEYRFEFNDKDDAEIFSSIYHGELQGTIVFGMIDTESVNDMLVSLHETFGIWYELMVTKDTVKLEGEY